VIGSIAVITDLTERRKAEDELRRSRAQLKAIFDNAHVGIRVTDARGNYIFVNARWAQMLGRKPEELIDTSEFNYIHLYDLPLNRNMLSDLENHETDRFNVENRFIRDQGEMFWGSLSATAIYDESGKIESVVGFVIDVTERKRVEQEVRESERRFREILQNIHLFALMLDAKGNVTFINDHFLEQTGWAKEDALGKNWFDLFVAADASTKLDYTRALKQGGIVARHVNNIRTRAGEQRTVRWSNIILRDIYGRITGTASIGEDITELAQAEQAEREQRAFAEALGDTAITINSTLDFEVALDRILENAGRVVAHDAATIILVHDNMRGQIVRTRGYPKRKDPDSAELNLKEIPNLHFMVTEKKPVLLPDTQLSSRWIDVPGTEWVRSYVGAPIIFRDKVVGLIGLDSATPEYFKPDHVSRLEAFANHAAIAIENTRLFEQSLKELDERKRAQNKLARANKKLETQLAEIEALQAQLKEQAIRDPVTGLFNRRYLEETLGREIARAQRNNLPLSIVMMDIDHFKRVNDTYGHTAGDEMLKMLGQMLLSETRKGDIACRYGGEEFAVIMPGAPLPIAQLRAEQWRKKFGATRVEYKARAMQATLSLGVASFPEHGDHGQDMLGMADQALYTAKKTGRDRVCTYSKTDEQPL
jgi:diguanylate cyclase (GGDEF)-like protein/PAS domain S-box-containing protein